MIDLQSNSGVIHKLIGQICAASSLLVQRDALDKLRQAPEGAGLEAWRRIAVYYEPMHRGHKLSALRRIINPKAPPGMMTLKAVENLSRHKWKSLFLNWKFLFLMIFPLSNQ